MKYLSQNATERRDPMGGKEMLANKAFRSPKARPWMKTISCVIILTFLFQQVVFGQEITPAAPAEKPIVVNGRIDLRQVSLPRDIAITKEVSMAKSEEIIIDIKDAHDNFGAQESIVAALENLLINYDVKFIGVEGSEGLIDMGLISSFPDEDIKKETAEYLMRQGKISAGEFFAATSKTPIMLYGIEDTDLYLRNYTDFIALHEKMKSNLKYVDGLRRALYALEDHVFSEELKTLNRSSILSKNGNNRFTRRWEYIENLGKKYGVSIEEYENIRALIHTMVIEDSIDYKAVNAQREKLLDILTKRLPRDQLEELILKSLNFKLGKISKSQFYTHLLFLAKGEELDRETYDSIEVFCDFVNTYESIDIGTLMDEIDEYECKIKDKLFTGEEDRELTHLLKNVEILHNLYQVRLTSGQLKYFRENKEDFSSEIFLDFIKDTYQKYGMRVPENLRRNTYKLFEMLPQGIDFYEAATKRNRAMVDNTIKQMRENGVTVGAIVTGGFHTRGISEVLKSDEVSYLILLPRFNARNNKRPYITVLTNKAAEYKHYVESGRYLAASSYFSMMQGILEGSGQEDTARKTRLEALAVMIGLYSQGRRERGTFSQRILNNMKERLMDQFKAGQEQKLKAGQITQGQYESLVNEMETLLDNTFVTWKGEVPQVFIKSTEGNFMYAVEAEKVEGETKPVVMLAAYDGISGKKIESVKLESQIMEAELAAGEAIDMGKELLARVQKLKNEQFLKRFGIEAKAQLEIEILKGKLADAEDLQEWLETKLTKMANAMRVDKGQVEAEAQKIISSRVEELTATLARAREGEVSPAKRVGEAVATRKAADDLEKEVRASKEFQDLVAKAEEQKPSDMMGSIKVVKHDFKGTGVAAFNYREGERTGILKEGRTLVVALNQSYIDEAVKMLEAAGITEITVTVVERRRKKEVKMSVREALEQELIDHEKKEDHWVAKRKVGERRGHILASAETALTW
ncbi:MAG: hypothetical protein WBD17_05075, partial [Candidatus Omnitrophota bacterium]